MISWTRAPLCAILLSTPTIATEVAWRPRWCRHMVSRARAWQGVSRQDISSKAYILVWVSGLLLIVITLPILVTSTHIKGRSQVIIQAYGRKYFLNIGKWCCSK